MLHKPTTPKVYVPQDDSCVLSLSAGDVRGAKIYDRSKKGNHGTITGAVLKPANYGLPALSFDGVDDYVEVADDASLQLGSEFTVSLWMKGEFDGADIFSVKAFSGHEPFRINVVATNEFLLQLTNSSNDRIFPTTTNTYNDNMWIMYTVTFDGGIVKHYVGGILDNTVDHSATHSILKSDQTDVYIGNRISSSAYFDGSIDEVRIYDRALSAEEVADHFNKLRHQFGV